MVGSAAMHLAALAKSITVASIIVRAIIFLFTLLLPALSACAGDPRPVAAVKFDELPALPDSIGFAGAFAGTSNGALIIAGGANFPNRPPWEGGQKVWHDRIFVLPKRDGRWMELPERLPHPLGYGVSVSTGPLVFNIGGG